MPPRKGVSNRRGAASREHIIEAAIELFAEQGYRGTGLSTLADRVGMSHVGVLRHFGTKENLLRAVLARRSEIMTRLRNEAEGQGLKGFTNLPDPTLPEALARLTTVLRAENLRPGDPFHDYFVDELRTNRTFLAAELRLAQQRGEMRADIDPDSKATEILAFATGVETLWLLAPDEINVEKVFRSYRSTLGDATISSNPKEDTSTRQGSKAQRFSRPAKSDQR
jgi:AcrR family transcriptional regulator